MIFITYLYDIPQFLTAVKMVFFKRKIVIFFLFLLTEAVLMSTQDLCYRAKIGDIMYNSVNPSFTI